MKKILFIALVVVMISGFVLPGCTQTTPTPSSPPSSTAPKPEPEKTYDLKLSYHINNKTSGVYAFLEPWTSAIEQATDGKVKITHYPNETLVKMKDQYDGLVSGMSDIAMVNTSETPGRFPQTEFDTLPYIFPDAATAVKTYWDILQKYSVDSELKEVQLLAVELIPPSQYLGNKPVQDVSDFQGLRVRSSGMTEAWTIDALGATPLEINTADLSTSMERGLVDGAFLAWQFALAIGMKDVTQYRTECSLMYRLFPVFMNKDVWNSFSPDIQKAIMDISGPQASADYALVIMGEEANAKGAIAGADKGAGKPPIYNLTSEQADDWKEAVKPVWDQWAEELEVKKLPGKAIINDIQEFNKKYSSK